MNNYSRIAVASLLCLCLTSVSCTPLPGQRLLTVQIESDGSVLYEGIRGVPDTTPVVEMWDELSDISFKSIASTNKDAEDGETNTRTVEGTVIVRIKHVNEELTSVSLKKLTIRSNDNGASWSLDAAEAARINESAEE